MSSNLARLRLEDAVDVDAVPSAVAEPDDELDIDQLAKDEEVDMDLDVLFAQMEGAPLAEGELGESSRPAAPPPSDSDEEPATDDGQAPFTVKELTADELTSASTTILALETSSKPTIGVHVLSVSDACRDLAANESQYFDLMSSKEDKNDKKHGWTVTSIRMYEFFRMGGKPPAKKRRTDFAQNERGEADWQQFQEELAIKTAANNAKLSKFGKVIAKRHPNLGAFAASTLSNRLSLLNIGSKAKSHESEGMANARRFGTAEELEQMQTFENKSALTTTGQNSKSTFTTFKDIAKRLGICDLPTAPRARTVFPSVRFGRWTDEERKQMQQAKKKREEARAADVNLQASYDELCQTLRAKHDEHAAQVRERERDIRVRQKEQQQKEQAHEQEQALKAIGAKASAEERKLRFAWRGSGYDVVARFRAKLGLLGRTIAKERNGARNARVAKKKRDAAREAVFDRKTLGLSLYDVGKPTVQNSPMAKEYPLLYAATAEMFMSISTRTNDSSEDAADPHLVVNPLARPNDK